MSAGQQQQSESRTQRVTAFVGAPSIEVRPSSIRWQTSRYNEAAVLEATGKTPGGPKQNIPKTGVRVVCDIKGQRVGAVTLDESRPQGDGKIFLRGFDAVRPLKQTSFSRSFETAAVTDVAKAAFERAGARYNIATQFLNNAQSLEDREELDQVLQNNQNQQNQQTERAKSKLIVTNTYDRVPCAKVIAECARRLDGVWYVDGTNTVQLRPTPDTQDLDVEHVLEFDGGDQKQPYTKVVVVGGQAKGQSNGLLSKEAIRAVAGNKNAPARQTRPPFRDKTIRSQKMAKNVANALLREYKKQAAYGTLELVGDERVGVLDSITLPGRGNPYFSAQSFMAAAVTHTIDDQGFKTTVELGGRTNPDAGSGSGGSGGQSGNGGGQGQSGGLTPTQRGALNTIAGDDGQLSGEEQSVITTILNDSQLSQDARQQLRAINSDTTLTNDERATLRSIAENN